MAILATRVVPTIDGTPTYFEISLRWIDAVGDLRSDVSIVDAAATDAQIELVVARSIARSNASLHTVRVTAVYAGEISKDNATADEKLSAQDNIVYHAKDAARENRRAFLPAPWGGMFVPNTDIPNASDASVMLWLAAWDALWAGTFSGVSLRFTQRSEINKKVNL